MNPAGDERLRRASTAVWRQTSLRTVVLTSSGDAVELTGAGALLWALLDAEQPLSTLARELVQVVGGSEAEAIRHLGGLLDQLGPGVIERR